ncbi:copine-3-like [Ostrea edulis]|uniref:copine-3-like n=1 Tax=Ostrea edulis TaxID=37623 RepID=UPI0024AF19C9|nr:copine-3-like [Ostrea edulis]XP_048765649.2 copine-3-like [Ostrea edulis]XP_048765652.2 copine-3-like [Ostrea edulis]XP_056022800.1 copine-3-like [Ostrea edulis]XP_056022804.1 copine-3-like [Ostrea edulis]XP_056022806.1 copine-3-like [Ostrea edulis]XP_056022811.1 copine-3-like [Ostrea edulis]
MNPYGGADRGPVSRVELRIECKALNKKDEFSKSDPCAALYMLSRKSQQWEELGRTELIKNCHDPKFAHAFTVDYFFEEVQKVKIEVYDLDNETATLEDDDFLGKVECNLGEIVSRNPYNGPLLKKDGKPMGGSTIFIRSEEIKAGGEMASMKFNATKLDNKDFLGKSDPYLEILKKAADGSWQVVHRTEVIKNTLNPVWRPFTLSVHDLCGGNKSQDIKFDCYDYDNDGSHDFIGTFTTTLEDLESKTQGGKEAQYPCINPKKQSKKKYQNSGVIHLTELKIFKQPSFLEFVYGGMQINFTVGIDFTGSNGNPANPNSLHYINPYQPNEYMQAIQAVGNVCQDYDTDKLFPALGFGAKLPDGKVSMEFAINFNPSNPYCAGIGGVLEAYKTCIQRVNLYGPTNVAPIVYHVARFAEQGQKEEGTKGAHAYFVLLLLTDGIITDMDKTRDAIVYASGLPMSLIIVGVGEADFSDMNFLDGDDGVLKGANGRPALRDIVQFVPFRDFKMTSGAELARHVLAEVPQQVVQYYKMRKIPPKPRPAPQGT